MNFKNYIDLKSSFFQLLILLLAVQGITAQPFSIEFDVATFKLASMTTYEPVNIVGKTIPIGLSEQEQVFYQYWKTPSFNDYQSLFLEGEKPDMKQTDFDEWRQWLDQFSIHIFGKVELERNGFELLVFQYYFETNDGEKHFQRPAFFKKHLGEYYSVSMEENKRFNSIKGFFGEISAEGLSQIMEGLDNKASGTALSEMVSKGKVKFLKDRTILSQQLLENIHIAKKEDLLSVEAVHPYYTDLKNKNFQQKAAVGKAALTSYMDSLAVAPNIKNDVLAMANEGQFVEMAEQLKKADNGNSTYEYAMKIREIYGDDVIKIWDSRTGKWK